MLAIIRIGDKTTHGGAVLAGSGIIHLYRAGEANQLTNARDYGSLVAASLSQEWSGFGQALFVQQFELARPSRYVVRMQSALLRLRDFRLPGSVFSVGPEVVNDTFASAEGR